MWTVEQVEAALLSARSRRGKEALDEAQALAWALAELRRGGDQRPVVTAAPTVPLERFCLFQEEGGHRSDLPDRW